VFASVNENFVSTAIEGVLAMTGGANSVDLESLITERISSRVRGMSEGLPGLLLPGASGARLSTSRCLL
jgi:hypothetical protein